VSENKHPFDVKFFELTSAARIKSESEGLVDLLHHQ
jgi:hypothetical protein